MQPWWAEPDWWTALGTLALVGVTCAAVLFAWRAFQLESDPVLVVAPPGPDKPEAFNAILPVYVVVTMETLSKGLELRRKLIQPTPESSVTEASNAKLYPWKSIVLGIHNAGRSPALGVTIDCDVVRPVDLKPGEECIGFEPREHEPNVERARDRRHGIQRGRGTVRVPVIAPQSVVYVRIENHIGVQVRVVPAKSGSRIPWIDKKRKPKSIAVVTPDEGFFIDGPSA